MISEELAVSDTPRILYKFLLAVEKSRVIGLIYVQMNSPDPLASSLMKSISAIINSSEMAAKLEAGTCYQLDNPISSKNWTKVNQTRRIPRKKVSHQAKPSPQLVECLQKASKSYQAISATRYG